MTTLPGPAPVPLLGWRANVMRFFVDPIAYMDTLPRPRGVMTFVEGGCPGVFFPGPGPAYVGIGAECNRAVLSDMETFHSGRVPGPDGAFQRLSAGLFNMNGAKHTQQRRLMAPAFHKGRVEGWRDEMVARTVRTLDGWRPGETRDLLVEMQRLTFSVVTRVLFGIEPEDGTHALGARVLDIIARSMSPLLLATPDWPGFPTRRLAAAAERVDADFRALVEARRAAGVDGGDVLSTLVATRDEDGGALTDDELIGQIFLLFFAGHDTTRNALAWTLFLLAEHPPVADALADELDGTLRGDAPTVEHLGRLPLLDRVVKESLRLFPPAPFTARQVTRPVEVDGHALSAGSEIVLSYYHSHRDPDVFPEPARFRPERWERPAPSPFAYLPFGAGARQCIGAGFANLEIRVVLAILLQRFRPTVAPGARIDRQTRIVISPHPGLPMVLRPRGERTAPAGVRGKVREMVALPA